MYVVYSCSLAHCFKSQKIDDIITNVKFSSQSDCKYMITSDKGGRCVVFNYSQSTNSPRTVASTMDMNHTDDENEDDNSCEEFPKSHGQWTPCFQFQGQEQSFDYLRSVPIDREIKALEGFETSPGKLHVLSANQNCIKLHKIDNRDAIYAASENVSMVDDVSNGRPLNLKSLTRKIRRRRRHAQMEDMTATLKKRYADGHSYYINSLAMNLDCEHFLCADDLRINLWNLEHSDRCLQSVDIKPDDIKSVANVITSAKFDTKQSNCLFYGTSNGTAVLCDMREVSVHHNPLVRLEI